MALRFRELPCARAQGRRLALQNGHDKGRPCIIFSRLPFNTGPSLKLSVVLVGVMAVFRHMLKVPNAGPLSVGSFGHIGVIEIGICGGGNLLPYGIMVMMVMTHRISCWRKQRFLSITCRWN